MVPSTRAWLGTRDDDQLMALVAFRPDVTLGPPVADLDDLARRLERSSSVVTVLMHLPRPAIEVLEALTALDAGATRHRVLELLDGGSPDDGYHVQAVEHWLGVLEAVGLAWPGDGVYAVNPGVHHVVASPLRLSPPARALVEDFTADSLKRLYRGLGVAAPVRKAELVAGIGSLYADPSRIRRIVGQAPADVAELLIAHAAEVAETSLRDTPGHDPDEEPWTREAARIYQDRQRMLTWASEHGIGLSHGYGYSYGYRQVTFPAEVLLALAPPAYRAPFHPEAPPLPTMVVSQEQTERASAAAVTATLAAVMATLESVAREPLSLLKAGGVGARELARVGKAVAVETAEVRLALELAAAAGVLSERGSRLSVGERFERWREGTPAQRAVDLLFVWWTASPPPTRDRDEEGKSVPALAELGRAPSPMARIADLLLPLDGAAVVGVDAVLAHLAWAQPLAGYTEKDVRCTWAEAQRFGVVCDGRLTRLGRAVHAGDRGAAQALLDELLPHESGEVLFGSDLTVVVPGSPSAALVDLLDTVAVRESHGVGATWRMGEASVRDALDRGFTVENLRAELRDAAGRPLPQTVEYLLTDVARRHGVARLQPAGCVVVSEDEALIAEIAATRSLRSLGLVAVAPTVLAGSAEPSATLALLRKAGYLPVEHDADGTRTVRLRARGPIGERTGDASGAEDVVADAASTDRRAGPGDEEPARSSSEEEYYAMLAAALAGLDPPDLAGPGVPRRPFRREPEDPAAVVARLRGEGAS